MNGVNTRYQYINLSYLNLMADNDQPMRRLMLGMLIDEIPDKIEIMNKLYRESNWEELCRVCHKMRTTLSFVGNELLASTNRSIGNIVKTQLGLVDLPDLFLTMNKVYPKVLKELHYSLNTSQEKVFL